MLLCYRYFYRETLAFSFNVLDVRHTEMKGWVGNDSLHPSFFYFVQAHPSSSGQIYLFLVAENNAAVSLRLKCWRNSFII